jgi:glycosyltransferase involved in cell wall biosynthesis
MRVCIFTETYYPVMGGGETQAKLLAEGLTANGHSAFVITRKSDQSLKKRETYGFVPVYRLPPHGRGQLKKWGLLFSCFPTLIRLRGEYDLIFVSGFRIIGISAVLISKLFRKKCILKSDSQGELSGAYFQNGLEKVGLSPSWLPFKLYLKIRNRILAQADAFSAISPDIAEEYSGAGIPPKLIHIIPNSVDTGRFSPVLTEQKLKIRERLEIPRETTVVVYTGRLVSYKGLPLLLKVWREIYQKDKNIYLLLLGTGGLDINNCEAELKNYVKENDLNQCVRFTGNVKNVSEYLQASDIFAFPTEDEAFGSSLIEAMACALPVITTPVGAIKTIVKDGQNGFIVKQNDFQLLHQALIKLFHDEALRGRVGQEACRTIRSHYSVEDVAQQYISLFENIAPGSTSNLSFGG